MPTGRKKTGSTGKDMSRKPSGAKHSQAVIRKTEPRAVLPQLSLSLQFADATHRALLPRHKVMRWLRHALDASRVEQGEFSVRIVGEPEGRELNYTYRQKDYATNVLTFDYVHAPVVQADLVICAPVVAREAREQGKDIQAHYAHLLVHGALHAQGWDHEQPDEAQQMEQREIAILARLGFANPYE